MVIRVAYAKRVYTDFILTKVKTPWSLEGTCYLWRRREKAFKCISPVSSSSTVISSWELLTNLTYLPAHNYFLT